MILFWIAVAFVLIILGLLVFTQGGQNLGPAIVTIGVVILLVLLVSPSRGQSNGHTHEGPVGRFYQSWMQPDHPNVSCCSNQDCGPAASRLVNGHWQAQEPEGSWVDIPDEKIEINRDSPDGRSHMCGRKLYSGFNVFCFARGGGA